MFHRDLVISLGLILYENYTKDESYMQSEKIMINEVI